ncbi:hypothetical protein EGW08_017523 [Elysia chlorotica]|uniref:Carboxylic ester hydrolase n=1 Tax=Elysia chlorotica TaxID=188477 RepID=A0A433SZI2_ELYCH|nr:hypothetical protein EGW08_017523 [Elysia chlorotica]
MEDEAGVETIPLSTDGSGSNGGMDKKKMDYPTNKRKPLSNLNVQRLVVAAAFLSVIIAITAASALVWSKANTATDASPAPYLLRTQAGTVKGSAVSSNGHNFLAYKSIPFAKPPIGSLRFKRPQPLDEVIDSQPINSDNYKKSCWSSTKSSASKYYGEDCLYLNVYVPVGVGQPFPVIVWLHGGGFVAGSTFPEPGKMVQQGHVIVVTVNYRLGVFGFMTTQDEEFPSNNGLWDQYMAIKWVHDNIHNFGGDSNTISLFGESAGAISTALHVISPVSSTYFQKVILQSGSMTSIISRKPERAVQRFAELVGCSFSSSASFRACLQNIDLGDILKYSKPEWYADSQAQQQVDFVWTPVIDGYFVPGEPLSLINNVTFLRQRGVFQKDYMIGVLNDEGGLLTTNFFYPLSLSVLSNSTFFKDLQTFLIENRFGIENQKDPTLAEAINTFYTGGAKLTSHINAKSVLDLCGDVLFVLPAVETALSVSNYQTSGKSKTFLFQFDYCPTTAESQAPCFRHGDIVALVFPRTNISDPVEAKLSDQIISLLASFAKTSDPGAVLSCGWPEFAPGRRQFLRISPSPDIRSFLYQYRMQFWLQTVPCILYGGLHCS